MAKDVQSSSIDVAISPEVVLEFSLLDEMEGDGLRLLKVRRAFCDAVFKAALWPRLCRPK